MSQKFWLSGLKQAAYSTLDPVKEKPAFDTLRLLFWQAIEQNATDLHFDPKPDYVDIRIRMDGHLFPCHHVPLEQFELYKRIIKLQSQLNIAERRLPQEGGFSLEQDSRKCDLRVSFMPTIYGEKCAIRFLPANTEFQRCEDLGLTSDQVTLIEQSVQNREGSIIISGPTGSGKSTTLHTILRLFPKQSLHILSIEDPVEIKDGEINQIQVQEEIGLTYQQLLKSMMRLDPDILLLGEVRDKETARIACEAALTGHFFLTTIHTKTTFDILLRLLEMGIEPYLISSSLSVLISERLVRKGCTKCAEKTSLNYPPLHKIGIDSQLTGKGCKVCQFTGYHGRVGVFEVVRLSQESKKKIAAFSLSQNLEELKLSFINDCKRTLQESFFELIKKGVTNWEEVLIQLENFE